MKAKFIQMRELGSCIDRVLKDVSPIGDCCFVTSESGKARAVIMNVQYYHALIDFIDEFQTSGRIDKDVYSHLEQLLKDDGKNPKKPSSDA